MTSRLTAPLTRKLTSPRTAPLGSVMGWSAPSVGSFSLVAGPTDAIYTGNTSALQDGNSIFAPHVAQNGHQWLYEYDAGSFATLNTLELSAAYAGTKDDHLGSISIVKTPLGAKLVCYAGHAQDSVVRFRRSSDGTIAGFGSEYTSTVPEVTTYPELFVQASTGYIFCTVRGDLYGYWISKSTDDGLTWSTWKKFVSSSNQMYINPYWSGADTLYMTANDNPTGSAAHPYCLEVNVSTQDVVSGAGTISNYGTSAAAIASCSDFYVPSGSQNAGGGGNWDAFGGTIIGVRSSDNQFTSRYYATPPSNFAADKFDTTKWTFTKICDAGYGTGDTAPTPYQYNGEGGPSQETGLTKPRAFFSRMFLGKFWVEQWECATADGTGAWSQTRYFGSKNRGLTDIMGRPLSVDGSDGRVPFLLVDGTFDTYTNFNTVYKAPRITVGSKVPTLSIPTAYSQPEWKALQVTLPAADAAGYGITGGADAALFNIYGNTLFLKAQSFAAPADANADNIYEVTITAKSWGGAGSADFNFTVTITSASLSASNGLTKTHLFNNAAWTKTAVTASDGTGETTDPFGGSNASKIIDTATTNVHRISQNKTLSSSTQNTNSIYLKKGSGLSYARLRQTNGGGGVWGGVFDIQRGNFISEVDGGLALDSFGIFALSNNWYRLWITFTTGTVSGGAWLCDFSGSTTPSGSATEAGNTGLYTYAYGAMTSPGALSAYADVA